MKNIVQLGTLLILSLLPSYLLRLNIFGIPTTVLEIMILILIFLWIVQNRKRLREIFMLRRAWVIFIALVVIASTISAIVAPDTLSAFGIWKAYFIEPILFFYLITDLLRQKQLSSDKILVAFCVGGLLVTLAALLQWFFNIGIPIPWDVEHRVTGLFDYPNALGLYLGPFIILSIGSIMKRPSEKNFFWISCVILFSTVIILAKSEAAIASVILTTIVMFVFDHKLRKPTIIVSAVALLILFSIPTSREFLTNKILLQDYSGQVRLSQWKETIELLKDHPIFGAGLSGYPIALEPYHKDTHIEIFQYPHNIFLNIWVELGLLGLITFFYLLFIIIQIFRPSGPSWSSGPSLLFFPLLQLFLHGLVDVPYFKNDLAILTWVLLALFYVASISAKTKQQND